MWLHTDRAFVSIVAHRDYDHLVLIRARTRDDLLRFGVPEHAVCPNPEADYTWRATMPKVWLATRLADIATGIDYPDVKSAVKREVGPDRYDTLLDVWGTLHRLHAEEPDELVTEAYARLVAEPSRTLLPVFVYGTLQTGGQLHSVIEHAVRKVVPAALVEYDGVDPEVKVEPVLRHTGWYPAVNRRPSQHERVAVPGQLLFLRTERHVYDEAVEQLDWTEGHPTLFRRTLGEVEYDVDGQTASTRAWVYVAADGRWDAAPIIDRFDPAVGRAQVAAPAGPVTR